MKVLWSVLAVVVAALVAAPFGRRPGRHRRRRPGRRGTAPAAPLRERHGRGRGVAAPVPAGVRAHLDVRDALAPDPAMSGSCTPGSTWPRCPAQGPVVAVAAGTVTAAGARGSYGNAVDVDHGGGITSRYAHLARIHPGISPGAVRDHRAGPRVEGSTGASTGNHLHLEILTRTADCSRPRAVSGPARRPPGRAGGRTNPPTEPHHRDGLRWAVAGGGWDRVRPAPGRHPAPGVADRGRRPHPGAGQGAVRRRRNQRTGSRGRCLPGSGWKRPPTAAPPQPPVRAPKG